MKKIIIILLLFVSSSLQAQFFPTPLSSTVPRLSSSNIWLAPQTFQNILPNGTRLYNLGSSGAYWLTLYSQNVYVDTTKTDIVFARDVVSDSTMTVRSYKQTSVVTIADSVIDCNLSNTFQKTLSANQRFVISNIGDGQTINVAVTNTAGNYTVTWVTPTGGLDIKWSGGTAPTATTGAKTDITTFIRIGTVIYGTSAQDF